MSSVSRQAKKENNSFQRKSKKQVVTDALTRTHTHSHLLWNIKWISTVFRVSFISIFLNFSCQLLLLLFVWFLFLLLISEFSIFNFFSHSVVLKRTNCCWDFVFNFFFLITQKKSPAIWTNLVSLSRFVCHFLCHKLCNFITF